MLINGISFKLIFKRTNCFSLLAVERSELSLALIQFIPIHSWWLMERVG